MATAKRRTALLFVLIPGALLIGGAAFMNLTAPFRMDSANYKLNYTPPKGWEYAPHTRMVLFRYKHPEANIFVRAAVNQAVYNVNPTPDLNTDTMADLQIDISRNNLKGWTADRMPDFDTGDIRFSMIRRKNKTQSHIGAFTVKGNTTVLANLIAHGKSADKLLDENLDEFKKLLTSMSLEPTVID